MTKNILARVGASFANLVFMVRAALSHNGTRSAGWVGSATIPSLTMPGYRELPESLTGAAAERAREAARLEQDGDRLGALELYEAALDASLRLSPEVPAFLCGRLAMLYRALGRHADEVALLERYRDSQGTDDARARFDARLSKALALAVKNRPRDSMALASVRAIRSASESRRLRRVDPESGSRRTG